MKLIAVTLVVLVAFSCKSPQIEETNQTFRGVIQVQGITSYQYGTHTLEMDEDFYALTSDIINLNEYLDVIVTLEATEIDGYPVDGGPKYLKVLSVVE